MSPFEEAVNVFRNLQEAGMKKLTRQGKGQTYTAGKETMLTMPGWYGKEHPDAWDKKTRYKAASSDFRRLNKRGKLYWNREFPHLKISKDRD